MIEYRLERKLIDLTDFNFSYYLPEKCIVVCVKTHEHGITYDFGGETVERRTYLYYLEPIDVS